MKKIAYVICSENHKTAFSKGFLNKSRYMLSQSMQGLIPPWKASGFYDERLNELGIIIAVGKYDINNDVSIQNIWSQIYELCRKYHIDAISAAEIERPLTNMNDSLYPIFQGQTILFVYKLMQGYINNKICQNSETGLLLNDDFDINYLKYLSDKQNYMYFYHKDKKIAQRYADLIYSYNGTAVQITDNIGTLKNCDVIIMCDMKMKRHLEYFPKHIYMIDPYNLNQDEKNRLETKVYTNKLGEMRLNASFIESLFYVYNNNDPINNLKAIEKIAENCLC